MKVEGVTMSNFILSLTRKKIIIISTILSAGCWLMIFCLNQFFYWPVFKYAAENLMSLEIIGVILAFVLTAGLLFISDSESSTVHRKVIIRKVLDFPIFALCICLIIFAYLFQNIDSINFEMLLVSIVLVSYLNIIVITARLYFWINGKTGFREKLITFAITNGDEVDDEVLAAYLQEDSQSSEINHQEINVIITTNLLRELKESPKVSRFLNHFDSFLEKIKNEDIRYLAKYAQPVVEYLIDDTIETEFTKKEVILKQDEKTKNFMTRQATIKLFDRLYTEVTYKDILENCVYYSLEKSGKAPWLPWFLLERLGEKFKTEFKLLSEQNRKPYWDSSFSKRWHITYEIMGRPTLVDETSVQTYYTFYFVEAFIFKDEYVNFPHVNNYSEIKGVLCHDKVLSRFFPKADTIVLGKLYWFIRLISYKIRDFKMEELVEYLFWCRNNEIGFLSLDGFSDVSMTFGDGTFESHEQDRLSREKRLNEREDEAFKIISARYYKNFYGDRAKYNLPEIIKQLESYNSPKPETINVKADVSNFEPNNIAESIILNMQNGRTKIDIYELEEAKVNQDNYVRLLKKMQTVMEIDISEKWAEVEIGDNDGT